MTHQPTPVVSPPAPAAPSLVIAGHGTRHAEGAAVAADLVARVRALLPGVRVEAGFVELTPPTISEALSGVLSEENGPVVVVPLMLGAGGHVRDDIPEAVDRAAQVNPGLTIQITRHLGAPAGMIDAARQRIDAAAADWAGSETAVVFVGRGCSVTSANADHVRLSRMLWETGGYPLVVPAFIQVVGPTIAEALDQAKAAGFRRIVVMPHYLFPGVLSTWAAAAVERWNADNPGSQARLAGVLGACPELAEVVVKRYREGALKVRSDLGSPSYLTGLLLAGRKAVAVGGGCVNRRRVPKLLAAGAEVTVVAPRLHPALAELAQTGRIHWIDRDFTESDLDGAWYVLAATDEPQVNAQVTAAAEARHTFCVRADRGDLGSAWTPSTGEIQGATLAVLADHNPRRSQALRDRMVALLEAADD